MDQQSAALTRALALVTASLALGACSLLQPAEERAPAVRPVPPLVTHPVAPPPQVVAPAATPPPAAAPLPEAPPAAAPSTREYRLGPAAQSLVTQARAQVQRGELPGASTTLDRAIRIEPNNPLLWIEVARLRLVENDLRQAEGCARKALALASGDRVTRSQAGHVLADALRAQRRIPEARELEAEPWMN